jgi:hypothetical protein
MRMGLCWSLLLTVCSSSFACGSSTTDTPSTNAGSGRTSSNAGVTGGVAGSSGSKSGTAGPSSGSAGNATVKPATAGSAGLIASAGTAGSAKAGASGGAAGALGLAGASGALGQAGASAGASGLAGGGAGAAGMSATNGSNITGTLGSLGAVQPIMAGFALTTSTGETAVYLSSAPLTCAAISNPGGRWLGSLPAGTQVIEIVVAGGASAMMYSVGGLGGIELNFAPGGMSSSNEKHSTSGTVTFTKASVGGVHEGSIMASNSGGMIMGTFHADWCTGGQEY